MLDRNAESFPVPHESGLRDVVEGIEAVQKRLPGKYLWDETGSEIFDRICDTPDYYLTRAETALLSEAAPGIASLLGPGVTLVEYGSGASRKVRLLLEALEAPRAYVALDISAAFLAAAAARVAEAYPALEVIPVVADFTEPVSLPAETRPPLLGFFPGSTIGNFDAAGVTAFLARARKTLAGGCLLIGHDPTRDEARLNAAYAGADGLMAALHLNMLDHLNRTLGTGFDRDAFRHEIRIERDPFRVEAHLVAVRPVTIQILDRRFEVGAGESVHTDSSYKMDASTFLCLAADAGWEGERLWTGPDTTPYALHLLRPA